MGKYQFSMAKVLNWRESQEEFAKKNFLQKRMEQIEQESILADIVTASRDLKVSTTNFTNVNTLRQQHLYKNYLDEQIVLQEKTLEKVNHETEAELQVFIGAQKDRKIMEKLKERQYEAYLNEEKHREQKDLDEMGTLRFRSSVS
ncbi:flagellar export protein FliJ [uncultured Vagococcus sp.]|uniref:flagellar export protein FliJ n=1 Tax=uncultured Vagococcus sp. TaxID=189676 RepID=UPI0028D2431C|nr:flagellar export protein FliJ [uncultured Vagococcus sp.]